jgi:signal transduction histidine kinase
VHFAETLLAGAIGSASARVMVASVVKEEPLGLDEVMNILDEASQVRAYSRELEQKSRELDAATAELRAGQRALRELDRMKDDFISTVTHELRTPLTSIRAFSEILHEDPKTDLERPRSKFLGIIVSETERLTRLINQILDLAKLESGRAEWTVDRRSTSIEVIREAADSLTVLFAEKHVTARSGPGGRCRSQRHGRSRPPDAGDGESALERGEVRAGRQRLRKSRRWRDGERGAGQRHRQRPGHPCRPTMR